MSQATFLELIAAKDPDVPKPDSTACMSGVREISFASKGHLRSVELLPLHKSKSASGEKSDTDPLFELYAVHSKGVTCLTITKADLGWDANSKVVSSISATEAVDTGIVSIKDLKLGSIIEDSSRTKSPPEEPVPVVSKAAKKKAKKAQQAAEQTEVPAQDPAEAPKDQLSQALEETAPSSEPVNVEVQPVKESKKSKKKAEKAAAEAALQLSADASRSASPSKIAVSKDAEPDIAAPAPLLAPEPSREETQHVSVGISGDWLDKEMSKLEKAISKDFKKEMSALYNNIQNDRLVQDSTASARQEAVLRLVSQTLTHNVEKSIASIVAAQMQQIVVPSISSVTSQAVQNHVGTAVSRTMQHMLPQEIGKHISPAVQSVLSSPQFARSIQEDLSHKLSRQLEGQISSIVSRGLEGAIIAAAERSASEVEARMTAQIRKLEEDRRRDIARMEKMASVISGMAETLHSMSNTQVAFQEQVLRDREQLHTLPAANPLQRTATNEISASPAPVAKPQAVRPKSKQEIEQDDIASMMAEGKYEEASIKWLQSQYPAELFDNLFIQFTPEYLSTDVSALVAFTIAVTVSKNLDTNVERRLEWVEAAMDAVDFRDAEIAELSQHAPQLLDTLVTKLEGMYMRLSEENNANPVIKQISRVARKARDMRIALISS